MSKSKQIQALSDYLKNAPMPSVTPRIIGLACLTDGNIIAGTTDDNQYQTYLGHIEDIMDDLDPELIDELLRSVNTQ